MKMSDWTILTTLYECRNITKAAELLYLSQPTLTKRLKLIEEEYGITIAERGKRGITFTPEGEYLAVKAMQIRNISDEIRKHFDALGSAVSRHISIGATNSFSRSALPDILQKYRLSHPRTDIEITTGYSSNIARLVELKKLDLGFINGNVPFRGERRLFCTDHAYLASTVCLDMERLDEYPSITYFSDPYTSEILENWWHELYTSPYPRGLKVPHGDICREMVLKGLGYSIFFIRDYMADYPEYIYPLYHKDGSPLLRSTWVITSEHADENPAAAEFLQTLFHSS